MTEGREAKYKYWLGFEECIQYINAGKRHVRSG